MVWLEFKLHTYDLKFDILPTGNLIEIKLPIYGLKFHNSSV